MDPRSLQFHVSIRVYTRASTLESTRVSKFLPFSFRSASVMQANRTPGNLHGNDMDAIWGKTRGCFRSASVQLAFRFRYPDVFEVLVFGGTWAWEV